MPAALDQGDPDTEPVKKLRQFHRDRPAAQNN